MNFIKGDIVQQAGENTKAYRGVIVASNKHNEFLVRWHKGYATWEPAADLSLVVGV